MTKARDNSKFGNFAGNEVFLDSDKDTSITADTDDQIDVKIAGSDVIACKTTGIHLPDGKISYYGSDDDFVIKHDGSGAFLENGTGNLNLRAKTGEASIIAVPDGSVELYYDNAKKFGTLSEGASIFNSAGCNFVIKCGDTTNNSELRFGDSDSDNPGVIYYVHSDDSMRFNTVGTERMRIDSSGNLKFNSGYGSAVTAYGVRAWVNFDGTSMGIRASGNVSSISDRGTGKFTVNLSVATPDDDGAVLVTSSNSSTATSGEKTNAIGVQNSTSALYINLRDSSNNSQKDSNYVHVAYLR